ncbi:MAG: hypothetical protein ACKVP0_20405 [Pirellulaceae bacterium]
MIRRTWNCLCLSAALAGTLLGVNVASAYTPNLFLADNNRWPGAIIKVTREGERDWHVVNPADLPRDAREAVPRIGSVAISPRGEVFYCSGLDGLIYKLEGGRPIVVHHHGPPVRDLGFGSQPDILFFSVVRTPQNGEPLTDGEIYRKNVRTGDYGRLGVVRQDEVGGNWWGSLAVHRGQLYISTMGRTSRILRQRTTGWETLMEASSHVIQGIDFENGGDLYFVAGTGMIHRSTNLRDIENVTESRDSRFVDLALEPEGASDLPGLGIEAADAFLRTGDLATGRP